MSQLRAQRETLEELWKKGLSGQALLLEQSRLVDGFIATHFNAAASEKATKGVALVALGGYGRSELFPYSDIDLLILFREDAKEEMEKIANGVLYPLWDTGLEVGHSVRTLEECLDFAKEDFFFQVAMLDARLLVGSNRLFDELLVRYRTQFIEGSRDEFVHAMKTFRSDRRKRFGSHSYLLEPNIKESKGGMRDIQAMLWTAAFVFGLVDLDAITGAGILLEEERDAFGESWNMLTRVRNRLHYISGRKNDQLYFEQQEEVAAAFGYQAQDGVLGVEHFMRDLYGHLQVIAVTTDLFFDHVDDVLGFASGKGARSRVVEKGIECRNNRIHLTTSEEDLKSRPYLLMRCFLASAKTGLPLHHRTRKMITGNLDLVTDKMRSSARMSKPFFEILESGEDVLTVLEVMLETGLLSAYIPEFGNIELLVQHDIYHIYTVDRHLLQSVADLQEVTRSEESVFQTIASPHVLFLATLLHDIGKMGIPDSILLKPGPLTPAEWEIMRKHPVYAFEWLSPIPYLQKALEIPYCHHERWDGTGYPQGLKEEKIPISARIFAIVDVWDALTSDRPYRKAWSKQKTISHIQEQSGLHFDPRVVDTFLKLVAKGL